MATSTGFLTARAVVGVIATILATTLSFATSITYISSPPVSGTGNAAWKRRGKSFLYASIIPSHMGKTHVPKLQIAILLAVGIFAVSCSQTTYNASTYRQTVTTRIEVNTNIPSEVWVSDRAIGTTPITFPFNYEEEVERQVKNANYWQTNPGWAAAVTVLSFGTYLPFSFIPAEPTSQTQPAGKFVNNKLTLRVIAENFEAFEQTIECKGEGKIVLNIGLEPKGP